MPKTATKPLEFFMVSYRGFQFQIAEYSPSEEKAMPTDRYKITIPHKLNSVGRPTLGVAMALAKNALDDMLEGKDPDWI